MGSDSGPAKHGLNAQELKLLTLAGMTPIEAIASATVRAADHVGLSDQVGTLEPGKAADIIAVDGEPTDNIEELFDVDFVMKEGRVIRTEF